MCLYLWPPLIQERQPLKSNKSNARMDHVTCNLRTVIWSQIVKGQRLSLECRTVLTFCWDIKCLITFEQNDHLPCEHLIAVWSARNTVGDKYSETEVGVSYKFQALYTVVSSTIGEDLSKSDKNLLAVGPLGVKFSQFSPLEDEVSPCQKVKERIRGKT